jgi:hypothetical protein
MRKPLPERLIAVRRSLNSFVLELDELCDERDPEEQLSELYRENQLYFWRDRVLAWLKDNLGDKYAARFVDLRVGSWGRPEGTIPEKNEAWRNFLLSLEDDVAAHPEDYPDREESSRASSADRRVVQLSALLRSFHSVAVQLRTRHAKRQPVLMRDEYDVQDLLRALLRTVFEDVRAEEVTPSYAEVARGSTSLFGS